MKLLRAVGIDLGTTNSALAALSTRGDQVELLEDRFSRKTFPSMVGWEPETSQLITTWEAWNRRALDPPPVASIKRKMGTTQRCEVGPHMMSPEQVSAEILKRLRREMLTSLESRREEGEPEQLVERAVITIPAYFDAQQIEATRKAGELAGLQVVGLLQEPTAAAMYYAWKHGIGDGTFLVYDLGGGTFDVSIIRCLMGEYQVLGIDGDNFLGGDDFDRKLAEHFRKHLVAQGYALDLDIANNPDDLTRFTLLQRLAQEVKEGLSQAEVQYVARRGLFHDQQGMPVSIELELSRAEFEALIRDMIEDTIVCCEQALAKSVESAEVGLAQVDHVLLVGGSTRVPLVQRRVAQAFCEGRSRSPRPMMDEPDTCVALGAAIHAANLAGLTMRLDDDSASMTFTSPLTTESGTLRLAGRLSGEDLPEEIASAVLINARGDVEAITRPEHDDLGLYVAIEEVALPEPGTRLFSLEFCDEDGDALIAFELPLTRLGYGERLRSTGSALSNPSVLAKDIYLEVVRDGNLARQVLLPSGASLPAEGKFRFYTTDHAGAVILRLSQNRLPIRTIHLTVPKETPIGTPVDLNLEVDATMAMIASGEVLGQSFWAQIEPPEEQEVRGWDEIELLLARVDGVARELWGYEAEHFKDRSRRLVSGIHEAARTDPDKLQVLVSRLEELLEEYHASDKELTPGWGRFTTLLDAIKRVVWRGDGVKLGLNDEQWHKRLSTLSEQGERAYEAHDQAAWSKVFHQVQAIWESLAQDESRFTGGDPAQYLQELHQTALYSSRMLRSRLDSFALSNNPETRQLQQSKLDELRREWSAKVDAPLSRQQPTAGSRAASRQELDRILESIQHIERQLDKLPTLGLVRR